MAKRGRPSKFSQAIADKICERLATTDLGLEEVLEQIKAEDGISVSIMSVWRWEQAHPKFREQSAHARKMQAQLLHDRAQKFAREPLIGKVKKTVKTSEGIETTVTVSDNVERSKLLVQTTLRRAGQLDSKKYGEKVTLGGDPDNPINHKIDGSELLEKILKGATAGKRETNEIPTQEQEVRDISR